MKVITTTYDGHINSIAFKDWEEARTYVASRLPLDKCYFKCPQGTDATYWTKLEYLEEESEGVFKKHVWELNEVSVKSQRSS